MDKPRPKRKPKGGWPAFHAKPQTAEEIEAAIVAYLRTLLPVVLPPRHVEPWDPSDPEQVAKFNAMRAADTEAEHAELDLGVLRWNVENDARAWAQKRPAPRFVGTIDDL
jgi:hypothetical protein